MPQSPQLTRSHTPDLLLVPGRFWVLQPHTHSSSFFSSCKSCGTSWPHGPWAMSVFPRHWPDIFSLPLTLDSTIHTFVPAYQPLRVFSFSVSLSPCSAQGAAGIKVISQESPAASTAWKGVCGLKSLSFYNLSDNMKSSGPQPIIPVIQGGFILLCLKLVEKDKHP